MELETSAKLAGIVSVAVGILVSLSTWYTGLRIQSSQDAVSALIKTQKEMEVEKNRMENGKTEMDESSRLDIEFAVPMARSFAIQYKAWLADKQSSRDQFVVPAALSDDITAMWPSWENRQGLMTGRACEPEGLFARQVVLLELRNGGKGDAVDVKVSGLRKLAPSGIPSAAWRESASGGAMAYSEFTVARPGWEPIVVPLPNLPGSKAADAASKRYRVVVASVSGRTSLYGTVIVPLQVSWKDSMTGKVRVQPVMEPNASVLNAELMGAEIGRMGDLCVKLRASER